MKKQLSDILSDDSLFATCAIALMVDRFGADFINWEPETVEIEVRAICPNPSHTLFDKLNAASAVLSTNLPHTDTLTFNNVVQVFNFDEIPMTSYIPASLEDVLWGCSEMRMLEGPDEFDKHGFSAEIKAYVGKLLVQHGITTPPSVLEFADISEDMILNRDDNLGGDSIMFQSYWDEQRDLKDSLEEFVINRTRKLLNQLVSLPVRNMDDTFVKNAREIITSSSFV